MAEHKKPQDTAMVPADDGALAFVPRNMDEAFAMSTEFAKSDLLPKHLRGRPHDVMITIAYGRELGLSPMQSIQGIYVVEGKPGVSAQMAVALVKSHPDVCEYFDLKESTPAIATYETKRRGASSPVLLSFTIEEAKQAGLTGKDNWRKYPAAMLRARAAMHLARDVYPDLIANVYDEDELREIEMEKSGSGVYTVAPPRPQGVPATARVSTVLDPTAPRKAAEEPAADAEFVDEKPADREPGADDDGPPSEEEIRAALAAAKTLAEVTALAPSVKLYAGEDKAHPLRVAYIEAGKRTKAGGAT